MKTHKNNDWKTKPTDRFVLKWIKCHLSAKITPALVQHDWLQPWMITVSSACMGVLGGIVFAFGWGWMAGLIVGASQVLDGVDGQFARLTGKAGNHGAFLDSVLDRYTDGAMVIGLIIYLVRLPAQMPLWVVLAMGGFALIGSNLISYSSARAVNLKIDLGKPTLASKGTRMTVMILSGLCSVVWPQIPIVALVYLAIHPNLVVVRYIVNAYHSDGE